MDIRSFFGKTPDKTKSASPQKKNDKKPDRSVEKSVAKSPAKTTAKPTRSSPRRSARKSPNKVAAIVDDSSEEEYHPEPTKKAPAVTRKKQVQIVDSDSDEDVTTSKYFKDSNGTALRSYKRQKVDSSTATNSRKSPEPEPSPARPATIPPAQSPVRNSECKIESPNGGKSPAQAKGRGGGGGAGYRPWAQESSIRPPRLGEKEIPEGAPGCLDGLTFVVTGVLESLEREQATDLIQECGGRITSGVSGKTSYLVAGVQLEDGREVTEGSKYRKATERNTPIIDEDGLFKLIRDRSKGKWTKRDTKEKGSTFQSPKPTQYQVSPPVTPQDKGKRSVGSKGSSNGQSRHSMADTMLWADKHKPKNISELIGNADIARKLIDWLRRWNDVHLRGVNKPAWNKENPLARAALLSGPPGIGKSSTAVLVAQQLGLDILEMNASDVRNKNSLAGLEAISSKKVSFGTVDPKDAKGRAPAARGRVGAPGGPQSGMKGSASRVLIMDEVDGMSSGDRGGISEIIKLIKQTKVPIICICNDRQSQKIRSLVNHCYDLRFRRPQRPTIVRRMLEIASKENLMIEPNAMELLIESCGNDVRQILNAMQMWTTTRGTMNFRDMKDNLRTVKKDQILRLNPFGAAEMIFNSTRTTSFTDRYEAYFVDYSLVPLLIQQNYIDAVKSNHSSGDMCEILGRLSATADAISDADQAESYIRSGMNWSLLPTQAALNVRAGFTANGRIPFPAFSEWLGKNSSRGKSIRQISELGMHMYGKISGSREDVRLDYLSVLRERLVRPLLEAQADGVDETIELLDEYGLSREDLMETMSDFTLSSQQNVITTLDSKVKSALTRKYNKGVHKSQGLADTKLISKKKRRATAPLEDTLPGEEGEEGGAAAEEDEEESDDDVSMFMVKGGGKKKGGKGGEKRAASSSSGAAQKRKSSAAKRGRKK